jgi:radical SAM protein (TIGR01212 family)
MYSTPYYTYREFMIDRYGEALQRVPVDVGFGCPNRDSEGRGGCSFCAEDGGRSMQTRQATTIEDQIDSAVAFARERYGAKRFMGYCQAYSGTFATLEEQQSCYERILSHTHFDAFTIGTRPDCLSDETLSLLKWIAKKTDLWIELGVQTANNETLSRINRGHDWESSKDAIIRLDAAGIPCAVHLIFGFPGESEADYHHTAVEIAKLPIKGIKFHNLHVIRNTILAEAYATAPFPLLDEHDYAEAVIDGIRLMPADIPIMRLQSDTAKEDLIAPHWQMKKSQFRDYVALQMTKRGWVQGDLQE